MPPTEPGPLPGAHRIALLDVVRGFALFGIFVMNVPGFSTSLFAEADGWHRGAGALNRGAALLRDVLFAGKFNSLFSLLFGIGFTLQYERLAASRPTRATAIYLRRLLVLLGIALLHAFVFWTGDVLHVYALLGVALLLLRRASNRTIGVLIVVMLPLPALADTLRSVVMSPETLNALVDRWDGWEASNNLAYGHGSFADAAREHAREFVYFHDNPWSLWNRLGFVVQMATTMLIGVLIGRHGWLRDVSAHMPALCRLQASAFVVGAACSLVYGLASQDTAFMRSAEPSPQKALVNLCYALSRLGLMAFYVLTIVRLTQQPAWQRRFAPMAAAGRLPLTNYLLQTAFGTALFYGWGFGLGFDNPAKPAAAAELLLAAALFFGVQVPLSVWWLRRFEQGPLEALWRRLTYGRALRCRAEGGPVKPV